MESLIYVQSFSEKWLYLIVVGKKPQVILICNFIDVLLLDV